MLLKTIIVILFLLIVASLACGYVFFAKDRGDSKSMRLLRALGTRVILAILLLLTIAWGIYSGQLRSTAPWDIKLHPERVNKSLVTKP